MAGSAAGSKKGAKTPRGKKNGYGKSARAEKDKGKKKKKTGDKAEKGAKKGGKASAKGKKKQGGRRKSNKNKDDGEVAELQSEVERLNRRLDDMTGGGTPRGGTGQSGFGAVSMGKQRRFVRHDSGSGSGSLYELVKVPSPTPSYSASGISDKLTSSSNDVSSDDPNYKTDFADFEGQRLKPDYKSDFADFAEGKNKDYKGDFADFEQSTRSVAKKDYESDFTKFDGKAAKNDYNSDFANFEGATKSGKKDKMEHYRSDHANFSEKEVVVIDEPVKSAKKEDPVALPTDDGWNKYAPDYAPYIPRRKKYRVRKNEKEESSTTTATEGSDLEDRFLVLARRFQQIKNQLDDVVDNGERVDKYEEGIVEMERRLADMQRQAVEAEIDEYTPAYSYTYSYEPYSYYSYSEEVVPIHFHRHHHHHRRRRRPSRRHRNRRMVMVLRQEGDRSRSRSRSRSRRGEVSSRATPRGGGGRGNEAANRELERRVLGLQAQFSRIQGQLETTDAEYREQANYFDHRLKDADTRAKKVEKKIDAIPSKKKKK